MLDIHSLEQTLAANLTCHKARIKFMAAFLLALITVKNADLTEIANSLAGTAKTASNYKRCQRFLRFFAVPLAEIAAFIIKLLALTGPWTLSLDRTNWKLGTKDLNLLVLGIVKAGIAYPIVWFALDKAGNSNTEERILIMELFLTLFGKEQIATLVADREFVGKKWLEWLVQENIPYQLRVKENFQVTNARGQKVAVKQLFRATQVNQPLVLPTPRQMWGQSYYFSGCLLERGEYLILVSPTYEPLAVAHYAQRWGIETLFSALKTRGFCLEQTHVTHEERLQKLVALLALAFCWCHKIGLWLHAQRALKLKKHGRPPQSIFRRGFDHIRRLLTNATHFDLTSWQQVINLLSCT